MGTHQNPQPMFLSRNKTNNVYPCIPQFYYKKWGLVGVGQNYIGMISWCTRLYVRQAKTGSACAVWSESLLFAVRRYESLATNRLSWEDWPDCAVAQSDLSLRLVTCNLVGKIVHRLILLWHILMILSSQCFTQDLYNICCCILFCLLNMFRRRGIAWGT